MYLDFPLYFNILFFTRKIPSNEIKLRINNKALNHNFFNCNPREGSSVLKLQMESNALLYKPTIHFYFNLT